MMMQDFFDEGLRRRADSMNKSADAMNKCIGEKFAVAFEKATVNQDFTDMVKTLKEDIALSLIDKLPRFRIRRVVFNEPATIVFWADGTKTVVKCQEDDVFMPETGIALCYMKKLFNNKGNYNEILKKWSEQYYDEDEQEEVNLPKAIMDTIYNLTQIYVQYTEKQFIYISDDFKKQLLNSIASAWASTDGVTDYAVGFRNGLRYAKSLIDGKEPMFEECEVKREAEDDDGKKIIENGSKIDRYDETGVDGRTEFSE